MPARPQPRAVPARHRCPKPLPGLEAILDQVARGELTPNDAAKQIRQLSLQPPAWAFQSFRTMGILSIFVGIGFGCYSWAFGIGAEQVPGRITKRELNSFTVEYQVNHKAYSLDAGKFIPSVNVSVGQQVPVLFCPNNPASGWVNTFVERWGFALLLVCGGVWFIICSYLMPHMFSFLTKFLFGTGG